MQAFLKSVLEDEDITSSVGDGLRAALVGIRGHEAVMSGEARTIEEDLLRAG